MQRPRHLCLFVRSLRHLLGVKSLGALDSYRLPRSPLARELALLNGPLLHDSLARGDTQIDAIFDFGGTSHRQLDVLYRTILSRLPRAAERDAFLSQLENAADRKALGLDLTRALLLGREFGSIR